MADSIEIDFETGDCVETFNAKLSNICDTISAMHHPYIGNKSRALHGIFSALHKENIKYNNVLELFSGGASVSLAFKALGKNVICNDILESSIAMPWVLFVIKIIK